ncbi:MAG: conjugal transfer protein TraF [Shewanella sp.]|nr:conjugal transfer protein TraF [Shewanella sp.]MCF1458907.1 conjugal transfer protein TraF [Shewanella sp.]
MNRKALAGWIVLMMSPSVMADAFVDARSASVAGAGIASGDFTRANLNPALLTRFADNDDFYLKLGVRAQLNDDNDTIDRVDAAQDQLNYYEYLINHPDPNNPATVADARSLIDVLKALDDDNLDVQSNAELAFYRPSESLAWGITISDQSWSRGDVSFVQSDEQLINNTLISGYFDQNDIASKVLAQGISVKEISFSLATRFSVPVVVGGIAVGVTPKLQRLDSYVRLTNVSNYDSDDYFDEQYTTDTTGFNFDVGAHAQIGPAMVGLVVRNLISRDVENNAGEKLSLKPTVTAGAAVDIKSVSLELDVDLIKDKSFVLNGAEDAFLKPRQWARLGARVDVFRFIQLRAGYRNDISGKHEDFYTVGLGISPFDTVTADLAAEFGEGDAFGGALQFGVKF